MKRPPVIVTRSDPENRASAARVAALGLTAVRSPVLALNAIPDTPLCSDDQLSGLVFTSATAVRFLTRRTYPGQYRVLPAWCIGKATATAAHKAGFIHTRESSGATQELIELITGSTKPDTKPLLHIANAASGEALVHQLRIRGFPARFAALYSARQTSSLDARVKTILNSRQPAIVLVHSAMGGQAFCALAQNMPASALDAIAISPKAAKALTTLSFRTIHVASAPNENSMLDTMQSTVAKLYSSGDKH